MLQYLDPVPFTIDNEAHMGLSETQGLLGCDGANLTIEFRIADTIIGMMKSRSRVTVIPLERVRSLRFTQRAFGMYCRLELRTLTQQDLEDVPESKQGAVRLIIRRRDRETAENFALEIGQAVLRLRREEIDRELES